jgi:hypothetical protein
VDDVEGQPLFVPSDGKRGSGKRVIRIFPTIHYWSTTARVLILDGKIDEPVLHEHATEAGQFIGFGSMRVENGGSNGRFKVTSIKAVA